MTVAGVAIWTIAATVIAGIVIRPWKVPEAVWAVSGAALLVLLRLTSVRDALHGVASGTDVYLFLLGMMLLSEVARQAGLFDSLAARAARLARGSAVRLFTMIYAVGTVVTIFLSNDATAVVLTPAVATVVRTVQARNALPYLLICAFTANAASFVLPISNPANLVIFGGDMPSLLAWLRRFILPSLASITATYVALRWTQRRAFEQDIESEVNVPPLDRGSRTAAYGILATGVCLTLASAFHVALGLPTCLAGAATATVVVVRTSLRPLDLLKKVAWSALALVAGLFVIVQALEHTDAIASLFRTFHTESERSPTGASWLAGGVVGVASNLTNNLPAGLVAGRMLHSAAYPEVVSGAVMIGVDLGPNLSVTGSLATILWLRALRADGQDISAWSFLKTGAIVMPLALALSLGTLLLLR